MAVPGAGGWVPTSVGFADHSAGVTQGTPYSNPELRIRRFLVPLGDARTDGAGWGAASTQLVLSQGVASSNSDKISENTMSLYRAIFKQYHETKWTDLRRPLCDTRNPEDGLGFNVYGPEWHELMALRGAPLHLGCSSIRV